MCPWVAVVRTKQLVGAGYGVKVDMKVPGIESGDVSGRLGLVSGIDLIEIDRIAATLERFGQRFLDRVYTEREQLYCRARPERLAGRFAVKEAVSKALGIGIRRIRWRDIEVLPNWEGKPVATLSGRAREEAERRGVGDVEVSITHSRTMAAAMAVALQESGSRSRDGGSRTTEHGRGRR